VNQFGRFRIRHYPDGGNQPEPQISIDPEIGDSQSAFEKPKGVKQTFISMFQNGAVLIKKLINISFELR
jgi:hypothetical protein